MALEWVVLSYVAAAEGVMVLLLTLPGLEAIRKGLLSATQSLLKPMLSAVPFCLFLLADIYFKYEYMPICASGSCSPSEHHRHQKSLAKSQRNILLIASALLLYWLLYSLTALLLRLDQTSKRIHDLSR